MVIRELFASLGIAVDAGAFTAAEAAIGAVKKGLSGLGIGLAAGAVAIAGAIGATTHTAGKFKDLSEKTGITTQSLQEMEHAGSLVGVSLESMTSGLRFLARNSVAAANGNAEMSAAFRKAGISVKDANGQLRPAEAIMADLADKLHGTANASERTALMMQLAGRGGAELIPVLKDGSAAFNRMREEAHQLGGVLSSEMIEAGDSLGDSFSKLTLFLRGLGNTIASVFLPEMAKGAEALIEWLKANREMIREDVTSFFRGVAVVLGAVWWGFRKLLDVALFLAKHWVIVASVLGTVLIASLLASTGALYGMAMGASVMGAAMISAAVSAAAAWIAATWPFLLVAALIVGIILLLEDLWVACNGGESFIGKTGIFQVFKSMIDGAGEAIEAITGFFSDFFAWLFEGFLNIPKNLRAAIQSGADAVREFVPNAVEGVRGLFGGGSSPGAGAGAAVEGSSAVANSSSFKADFNITAPAGSKPEEVASAVRESMDEWHATKMREAYVAVEE